MDEAKAAAYYEQLVREGGGAAKFKQGLGYSSAGPTDAAPSWGRSSSNLSGFVPSSAGGNADSDAGKEARLSAVKAKLAGKSGSLRESDRPSSRSSRGGEERRTRRSRSRSRSRSPRRRQERSERRRTSRRSLSPERRRRRRRSRSRSRSSSPRRRSERSRREDGEGRGRSSSGKEKVTAVDYSKLIEGYTNMTSAERVKAKMKLQLSQTAAKDKVMGKGWERFEFDKDAPLDDNEDIEVADDDAKLVKNMNKTFRFSSLDVKRESDLEAAHDQAIFGVPSALPENKKIEDADRLKNQDTTDKSSPDANLVSEKVLSMHRGSWRDKVRNHQKG